MPNPDGSLTQEELNRLNNPDGTAPAASESLVGQTVILNGQTLLVKANKPATADSPSMPGAYLLDPTTGDTLSFMDIKGQPLVTGTGDLVSTDYNGKVISSRKLSQTEFGNVLTYGSLAPPQDGGSGGGRSGVSAPNPLGALNASLDYWKAQVAAGEIPREQAKEEFNRYSQIIEQQQNAAIAMNRAQNEFDATSVSKAANEEDSLRKRQEDATNRALNIQQERTTRQQDISNNILPYSVGPNAAGQAATSMQIPLLGNLPLTQINPNQYADIQGLNQIPTVSQGLQSVAPNPTAPMQIPMPSEGQYPQLPLYSPPPLPNVQGLINQIAGGFTGWS